MCAVGDEAVEGQKNPTVCGRGGGAGGMSQEELGLSFSEEGALSIRALDPSSAGAAAQRYHYLHRAPSISQAWGLFKGSAFKGLCTFGSPATRHLQLGVCPTEPGKVIEFNRLWVDDSLGRNSESWFVARCLKLLPPLIVVSYADTRQGHLGYIYRALNFFYAGWTDMERKTPRPDYLAIAADHSRDAFRGGHLGYLRRGLKIRYWTLTGNRRERRRLEGLCAWPKMNWKLEPPPTGGRHYKRFGVEVDLEL